MGSDPVIVGSDPQSTNSQILGWIDTKDETKTIYTTDESLAQTEGYAPIGSFVVREDTTFEAVTIENKDWIHCDSPDGEPQHRSGQARNDSNDLVIPAPEPESNNNPIQENKDWIAGQARNDGENDGDAYIPFSEKVGSPAPVSPNSDSESSDFELGALGGDDIGVLGEGNLTATFGGISLGTGNDTFATSNYDGYALPQVLHIEASFEGTSGKQIKITTEPGMGFDAVPGMIEVASTTAKSNWTWSDTNPVPDPDGPQFSGASYVPADYLTQYSYQPRNGELTYNLVNGTTGVKLDVTLSADKAYLLNNGSLTLTDLVTVELIDDSTVADTEILENYTISGNASNYLVNFGNNVKYAAPDQTWSMSFQLLLNANSLQNGIHYDSRYLYKELQYEIRAPKAVGITGARPTGLLLSDGFFVSAVDQTNDDYDAITITIKPPYKTSADTTYFFVDGKTITSATPRQSYNLSVGTTSKLTLLNGDVISSAVGKANNATIIIATSDEKFVFDELVQPYIYAHDWTSPADMVVLGGFFLKNPTAVNLVGRRLHIDFDTTSYGVKAVKLAAYSSAKNVVVTTTAGGPPLYYESLPVTNGTFLTLNLGSVLGADEYITSIEYGMGTLSPGNYANSNGMNVPSDGGIFYYGKLLGEPQSYSATATIFVPKSGVLSPDYENAEDWDVEVAKTQDITLVTDARRITYANPSNNIGNGTLLAGGEAQTISSEFKLSIQGLTHQLARKGFDFYVREPKGFLIDPNSITVTYGTQTFTGSDFVTELVPDAGATNTWKVTLPDVIIGMYKKGPETNELGVYPSVKVSANIAAINTTPSGSVLLRDILMGTVEGAEAEGHDRTSGSEYFFRNDDYNFTGSTSNHLASALSSVYLNVQAQQNFSVSTAANRGNDPFRVYNPNAEGDPNPTIISLNTQLSAHYQLTVANGSGDTIYGGYDAIIPIPKEGDTVPEEIKSSSDTTGIFGWSEYLAGDVAAELAEQGKTTGFSVKYALDYELNKDAGNGVWLDYAAVSNPDILKTVKAVKISYNQNMADKFSDSFYFTIKTPQGDEAKTAQGATNIYSAYIHRTVGVTSGYAPSAAIALRLNTGLVSGTIKTDDNRDGSAGAGEDVLSGVTVRAYKAGIAHSADTLLETKSTDANGFYQFVDLSSEQAVDIVVEKNVSSSDPMRYVLPSVATDGTYTAYENVIPSGGSHTGKDVLLQRPYTVTFYPEGGIPAPSDQKVYTGDTASKPTVTKVGYNFDGWKVDSVSGSAWNESTPVASDLKIYAKWTAKTVAISYNGDGGFEFTPTEAQASQPYDGKIAALPVTGKVGQFYDWYVVGTNIKWVAGTTVINADNGVADATETSPTLALEARYRTNDTYVVNYFAGTAPNGGTITGDAPAAKSTQTWASTGYDISKGELALDGYKFKEWNTLATGNGVSVDEETTYSELVGGIDTPSTSLYAIWEVNTEDSYWNKVTFDDNGSTSGGIANILYVAPTKKISEAEKGSFPDDPTKTHYLFDGWKVNGTETKYATSADAKNAVPEANITLVAQWKVNTDDTDYWNTVAFDHNGATSGAISEILYVAPDNKISEAEKGLFPSDPAKTHYIFDGWKVSGTNTKYDTSAAAKEAVPAGDITLVAQWKVNTDDTTYWAKVTFDTNGGSAAPAPVYVSYGNADPALDGTWPSDPTRAGYDFSGWFDGNNEYDDSSILGIEVDTTVVAKWTVNDSDPVWAKVSFDANGGTGAPSAILYNTSEKKLADGVSFPTTKPSLTGYTFANWNTKANGNGSIVNADNLAPSSNITLYALYNANGNTAYKVEHYLVDASGSASLKETSNHTAKTDTTANATAKTYEHYTLNSAHSSAVASGNVAGDGSLVLKLYYGINHNTVSYSVTGTVPEGAPSAPAASDVAYGQTVNVASALAFDGYTFSGWTADGVSGESFTMPDSAVAFTGSWTLVDNGGGDGTGGQNDGNGGGNNNNGNTVVDKPNEPKGPDTGTRVTTRSTGGGTTTPSANNNNTTTAKPSAVQAAHEQGISTFSVGGLEVPLTPPAGYVYWSLLDFIFVILGLFVAGQKSVSAAVLRNHYRGQYGEEKKAIAKPAFLIATIAFAVGSLVLFLVTQDITKQMVLVDWQTTIFTVLFAAEMVAAQVSSRVSARTSEV